MADDDSGGDDGKDLKDRLLVSQYLRRKSERRAKIQYYLSMALAVVSVILWVSLLAGYHQGVLTANQNIVLGGGLVASVVLGILFSAATEEMNRWKFGDILEDEL